MLQTDESDYRTDPLPSEDETPVLTDSDKLDLILASQLRVETAVTEALEGLKPMLAAVQSKGIMGLMTMGK